MRVRPPGAHVAAKYELLVEQHRRQDRDEGHVVREADRAAGAALFDELAHGAGIEVTRCLQRGSRKEVSDVRHGLAVLEEAGAVRRRPGTSALSEKVYEMIRTALLSFSLLALMACGEGDTAEQYITRAQDALAKSEYSAAMIELKNALRLDPNSAQARWLLGKVYLESADMPSAVKELERALKMGWSPDDVKPALGCGAIGAG